MKRDVQKMSRWARGSFVNVPAEVAAKAFKEIADKDEDGRLLPDAIVSAAKAKRHALHEEFDWDDATAAHTARCDRARYLVRHLEIVVPIVQDDPEQPVEYVVREYTSVGNGRGHGRNSQYQHTLRVFSDEELGTQAILKVLNQLLQLKRKYRDIVAFSRLWPVIDDIQEELAV